MDLGSLFRVVVVVELQQKKVKGKAARLRLIAPPCEHKAFNSDWPATWPRIHTLCETKGFAFLICDAEGERWQGRAVRLQGAGAESGKSLHVTASNLARDPNKSPPSTEGII